VGARSRRMEDDFRRTAKNAAPTKQKPQSTQRGTTATKSGFFSSLRMTTQGAIPVILSEAKDLFYFAPGRN